MLLSAVSAPMPRRGWSSLVSEVTPAAYMVIFLSDGEGTAGISRRGPPATEGLVLQVTPAAHTGVRLSNGKGILASNQEGLPSVLAGRMPQRGLGACWRQGLDVWHPESVCALWWAWGPAALQPRSLFHLCACVVPEVGPCCSLSLCRLTCVRG